MPVNARKIQDILRRIQRLLAIRICAGYRTVSADAALLLARLVPTMIKAAYYKRVFLRIGDLKRKGEWNPIIDKEIKKDEKILIYRQWKIFLQQDKVAGVRTCNAILPNLERWCERSHGEITFRMTQLLSGHGYSISIPIYIE